jgi:hypothetical protein
MVVFASDHFRSSVAGAPAGCLERLARPVGVRQAEVHNLDVIVVVHQQVFRLQITVAYPKLV